LGYRQSRQTSTAGRMRFCESKEADHYAKLRNPPVVVVGTEDSVLQHSTLHSKPGTEMVTINNKTQTEICGGKTRVAFYLFSGASQASHCGGVKLDTLNCTESIKKMRFEPG